MKKLSLTVRTLAASALLIASASCSDKSEGTPAANIPATETTTTPSLNIRYINADSLMSGYKLAQQIAEESQRMMLNYQKQEQQKSQEIQNLGNSIAQKRQNNTYFTAESYEADVNNFNKKQEEAQRVLAAEQNRIQTVMAKAQMQLNDSIANCARDFARANGYDAVPMSEAGVYFNPALDVTAALIEELNKRLDNSVK